MSLKADTMPVMAFMIILRKRLRQRGFLTLGSAAFLDFGSFFGWPLRARKEVSHRGLRGGKRVPRTHLARNLEADVAKIAVARGSLRRTNCHSDQNQSGAGGIRTRNQAIMSRLL